MKPWLAIRHIVNRSYTWCLLVVLACLVPAPVFAFHPVLSKLDFIVNYAVYPEIDYGGGEQSATRRLCQLQ